MLGNGQIAIERSIINLECFHPDLLLIARKALLLEAE
jgi:hypothetical protein